MGNDNFYKNINMYLDESKKYAKKGYKESQYSIKILNSIVLEVTKKLNDNIKKLNQYNTDENSIITGLLNQLNVVEKDFIEIPKKLNSSIDELSIEDFHITLFGRTMAGKSTFMEIITKGSGESIGNGSQRTTRDVRNYKYNNMVITDVPGIAAFEGSEDEELAFEVARKSDLILFLITNDAPQSSEADCLYKILNLGKPVIGIINFKIDTKSIDKFKIKVFKNDIERKINNEKSNQLINQLTEFGEARGQNWRNIKFVNVHLKSAYLSQRKEWQEHREILLSLSNFNSVESEICRHGKFYKIKSFFDVVIVELIQATEILYKQGIENYEQSKILNSKRNKLEKWKINFIDNTNAEIDTFVIELKNQLNERAISFASNNYDNSNVSDEWNKIIDEYEISEKTISLLEKLSNNCNKKLQEINREISFELNYEHKILNQTIVNMSNTVDHKKISKWTTNLISSLLIVANIITVSPFFLVASAVVSFFGNIFSNLFKSKSDKTNQAIENLEKQIFKNNDKLLYNLKSNMINHINDELIEKQVDPALLTLNKIVNSISDLSNTQWDLANKLNYEVIKMNKKLFSQSLQYLDYDNLRSEIIEIARIPGSEMIIRLKNDIAIPIDIQNQLSNLFNENVRFIIDDNSRKSILIQSIGLNIDTDNIKILCIDNIPRIVNISHLKKLDSTTKIRIRLAQQLTKTLIIVDT